jgi:hypothetical protein
VEGKRLEQIKLYLVIGLALVFVIVAYFRFTGAKGNNGKDISSPVLPPVEQVKVATPKSETKGSKIINYLEPAVHKRVQTVIRDIFSPLAKPKEANQDSHETSRDTGESLTLAGTIVGGRKPIAIINDQFVRTGDWIGGFRLVRIGEKDVLLDSGNHKIVLEIMKND